MSLRTALTSTMLALLFAAGCPEQETVTFGARDTRPEAAQDTGELFDRATDDTGSDDASSDDAGVGDMGATDTNSDDTTAEDMAVADTGAEDVAIADTDTADIGGEDTAGGDDVADLGTEDTATTDSSATDTSAGDTGVNDTAVIDTGAQDTVGDLADMVDTGVEDTAVDTGVDAASCIPTQASPGDGNHNAGLDCMNCHTTGPTRRLWTVAGTLYDTAAGDNPVVGATIIIVDDNGQRLELVTTDNGNFYTTTTVAFPLTVSASRCPDEAEMSNAVNDGSCNSCHVADSRIHLP